MNNLKKYSKNIINSNITIIDALYKLDKLTIKTLLVNHDRIYLGTITDGDIRRGLLNKFELNDSVYNLTNKNSDFIEYDDYKTNTFSKHFGSIDLVPIIKSKKLFDILINHSLNKNHRQDITKSSRVVIMAGGEGTRMRPLTQLIPKPLIPYKDTTLIEHVMNNFLKFCIQDFTISVNYKSELIVNYFKEKEHSFNCDYLYEEFPMGTIGALHQLDLSDKDTFVCNCDSLIDIDFYDMQDFHKQNKFDLTIAACKDIINIPYGVCAMNNDFSLNSITEKPQINHLINSGLYLMNSKVLSRIPNDRKYSAVELIEQCQKDNLSIGVYPFSKDLWLDVGVLSDYLAIL